MVPKIGLTGATRWGETRRTMASAHGCRHLAGPNGNAKTRWIGHFFPVKRGWFDPRDFNRYNPRLFCGPIGRPRSCNNVCRDSHGR
jgi:hypothetical protein